jgi:hypothetical protein
LFPSNAHREVEANQYYLTQIQTMIAVELGRDHFYVEGSSVQANAISYARILFAVGLFNLAVQELQQAGLYVEAVHFMIALSEIGLLITKQDLAATLRPGSASKQNEILSTFTNKDLAVVYEQAIDNDVSLMALVSQVHDGFLTECFTLLFMIKDQKLQEVAICNFIQTHNRLDMLLEIDQFPHLNFSINKEVSLLQFLKH